MRQTKQKIINLLHDITITIIGKIDRSKRPARQKIFLRQSSIDCVVKPIANAEIQQIHIYWNGGQQEKNQEKQYKKPTIFSRKTIVLQTKHNGKQKHIEKMIPTGATQIHDNIHMS